MSQDLLKSKGYLATKRTLDAIGAGLLLLLLLPVLSVVAVLVRVRLGPPVLFLQQRPGKDEALFTLIKFRSMVQQDSGAGVASDRDRLTHFGKVLRSTSLDELPSLWNILKGEMSFVGPRPLLVSHLPRYSPEQCKRHLVRPGLTGLAQVNGRNLLPWDERLALDVEYVDHMSLRLDLQILLQTVAVALRGTGVSQSAEEVTMEEFFGPMSFPTLTLQPIQGVQGLSGIEVIPECSCGREFHVRDGSTLVEYQNWVTLRNRAPRCHDWVAVDPGTHTAKAVCGLTLVGTQLMGQGTTMHNRQIVGPKGEWHSDPTVGHQQSAGQPPPVVFVAELYVAVLRPDHPTSETEATREMATIAFQAISLVTTRALAMGVKELRVTCTKTNNLMLTPLMQFGFEIIKSVLQTNNYLLRYETNLGQVG